MKKKLGVKNWMFPMPVLMIGTYSEDGTPDMMNAAWGGITLTFLPSCPASTSLRKRGGRSSASR